MKKFLNDLKTLCDLDHLDGLDVNTSEEEILEIFKKIVISRKIEEPDQLNLFLNLISWNSSKLNKPQDTFVLEIFNANDDSGIPMWNNESIKLWKFAFPNIDFDFIKDESVKIYGVEAAGYGIETGKHAAAFQGQEGVIHGMKTFLLQDKDGNITPAHSISAGLDYPGVGPEHAYLKESGRSQVGLCNDDEAVDAFYKLSQLEGIIPALESAHTVGFAMKLAKTLPKTTYRFCFLPPKPRFG